MLDILIPETELYDETTNRFLKIGPFLFKLEHCLSAVYDWESKWHKSFFSDNDKSNEETLSYVWFMNTNSEVPEFAINLLTDEQIVAIRKYIDDPMTATTFSNLENAGPNRTVVTSELIYYWMTAFNIPFECQYWHLNRLLTLIQVCNIKNSPSKKMSMKDTIAQRKALNEARKQKYKTKG